MDPVIKATQRLIDACVPALDAFARVAKQFGMKPYAVKYKYYKNGGNNSKKHGNKLLTTLQEQRLLIVLLAFSTTNHPVTPNMVRAIVEHMFNFTPDRSWCRRYFKHFNAKLKPRRSKHLSKKRNCPEIRNETEKFIAAVESGREIYPMNADNVVNYDETRICYSTDGEVVLDSADKERGNAMGRHPFTMGSLLPFVTASGEVLCNLWILKARPGKNDDELCDVKVVTQDKIHPTRGDIERYYLFTETGYVDTHSFTKVIDKFAEVWARKHTGRVCWCFGDQLATHASYTITKLARDNDVLMYLLPANTSHFLQPLDSLPFANLKSHMKRNAYESAWQNHFRGEEAKEIAFALAYAAEENALTPRILKSAFRRTGVFPWNPNLVTSLMEQNVGNIEQKCKDEIAESTRVAANTCADYINQSVKKSEEKTKMNRTYQTKVRLYDLHDPNKRIEYHEVEAHKGEAKAKEKEERKKAKEAGEKARKQRRAENTCAMDGCKAVSQGGKLWNNCGGCGAKYCPKHKSEFLTHATQCNHQNCVSVPLMRPQ